MFNWFWMILNWLKWNQNRTSLPCIGSLRPASSTGESEIQGFVLNMFKSVRLWFRLVTNRWIGSERVRFVLNWLLLMWTCFGLILKRTDLAWKWFWLVSNRFRPDLKCCDGCNLQVIWAVWNWFRPTLKQSGLTEDWFRTGLVQFIMVLLVTYG